MDEKLQIFKFKGTDFAVWRAQVQAVLTSKGYQLALTKTEDQFTEAERKAFNNINNQVKAMLLCTIDPKYARMVINCRTAKEIWDRLCSVHEQKSTSSRMVLQREFFDLKMKSNEKIEEYVSRAEMVAGQLQDIGSKMPDQTVVAKIVSGLPEEYQPFMTYWNNTEESEQNMANLLAKLLAEEHMKNQFKRPESSAHTAITTTNSNLKKGNKNKKRDLSKVKCYNCQKMGHFARDCKDPKVERKQEENKKKEAKSDDGQEYGAAIIAEANSSISSDEWILDSGATEHMTFDAKSFISYRRLDKGKTIRFGNNQYGLGIGVGDIKTMSKLSDGSERALTLKNVLHVPELGRKLLSIAAATDQGAQGEISEGQILLKDACSKVLLVAHKCGNLYRVNIREIESESNASEELDDLTLLHERFGHINKRTLVDMAKKNSVVGLRNTTLILQKRGLIDVIDCEACALGKQARKHFTRSSRARATSVGSRVHVDLCGPFGVETISGCKYFVLFKDEYSNFRHIYFIKSKDEVFKCLKLCTGQFEADTNKRLKCLVSDCGSEFTSRRAQELLAENRTARDLSAPFTPQQNGFIERDNRTVLESARAMLFRNKLPGRLWGEAANTAVYLLNRSCNKNTGNVTPYELYFKRKPCISHLRIFGCLAYMKMQEKKRSGYQSKLEARSQPTILVGYDRVMTYRLFEPSSSRILITRETDFDERKSLEINSNDTTAHEYIEIFLDKLPIIELNEEETRSVLDPLNVTLVRSDEQSCQNRPADDEETQSPNTSNQREEPADGNESIMQVANEEEISEQSFQTTGDVTIQEEPVYENGQRYNLRPRNRQNDAQMAEAWLSYGDEPSTFEEAISSDECANWKGAMNEEYESLIKNQTWTLTVLPEGRKTVKCRWVYRVKRRTDGSIERFKARLVAKGYSQRAGIDYQETFSPVVRLDSVRILLAIVAAEDLEMVHFDVKTAFLNGQLKEEVYMDQPEGYTSGNGLVCKLLRSLYGLKQAPKVWNDCLFDFLKKFDLRPLEKDPCILVKNTQGKAELMIAIYVDDGLVCSGNRELLYKVISYLRDRFEISVMDPTCFVGLKIERNRDERTLKVHQGYYINKIVERFGLENAKGVSTPFDSNLVLTKAGSNDGLMHKTIEVPYREAIGSLNYALIGSRPDIAYALGVLSSYSAEPKGVHWQAVKRVVVYLRDTAKLGLHFGIANVCKLEAYADAGFAADLDTRRSTAGFIVMINGTPVVWRSTKEKQVASSTTEAELIAASLACKEVLWCRQLLKELGRTQRNPTPLYVDNQGAISLIENPQTHARTKHIDIIYMFVRQAHAEREICVKFVPTSGQNADALTKGLAPMKFKAFLVDVKLGQ